MEVFSFMIRSPQRSYTPRALECWFDRMMQDWEKHFSRRELLWGRSFYRTGEVRSTELLDNGAIVNFKQGREEIYVIVDWENGQPSFRQSDPKFGEGQGLAVAAMYEVEELLADEIPAVPTEAAESENATGEETRAGESGEEPSLEQSEGNEQPSRKLQLELWASSSGLDLRADWVDDAGERANALELDDLTTREREKLIQFTAMAHRVGFKSLGRQGLYRVADPAQMESFLGAELSRWKSRFVVVEDSKLEAWKPGKQVVHPTMNIRRGEEAGTFFWGLQINDAQLNGEESQQVLKFPRHVHFIPGKGIYQVDQNAMGALDEWRHWQHGDLSGNLPRYMLFSFLGETGLQLDISPEIEAWRGQMESQPEREYPNLPDFLRPYQRTGIAWMDQLFDSGCHGLLADEMGLGKTIQVLSVLNERAALTSKLTLIVCPASVVPVWETEIQEHFTEVHYGILSSKEPFSAEKHNVWLSSYTQLRRHKHVLEKSTFDYVVLDEAQSIKNPDAKVTQACFALHSHHRFALTGTPLENRPLDLWTLFRFLMPGLLGSRRRFEDLFKQGDSDFNNRLRKQITPFILRRTKDLVAEDLPPKMIIPWRCTLTPTQRKVYREIAERGVQDLGNDLQGTLREKPPHLFSLLTRLRQVSCDPQLIPGVQSHWEQSGKLASLVGRMEGAVAGGSKVVIFSQFVQFLKRIRSTLEEVFPEVPLHELTGATRNRAKPVREFREAKGASVFLVSLRAGGTGLNLQTADYVFLLDPWWNPAVEAQAIDRVHRIGQKNHVYVYRFITTGTIEERVEKLKESKADLFNELMEGMDAPVNLFEHFSSLEELISLE